MYPVFTNPLKRWTDPLYDQKQQLAQLFSKCRWDTNVDKSTYESFASTLPTEEFKQVFEDHLDNLSKRGHVEFYDLPSTDNMTEEQTYAVMEVLSRKLPRALARHADSYIGYKRNDIMWEKWAELLSKNSPGYLLYYHRRFRAKSPETQTFVDNKVKSAACRHLKEDPTKLSEYGHDYSIKPTEPEFTFESKKEILSRAAQMDSKIFRQHVDFFKPTLSPSERDDLFVAYGQDAGKRREAAITWQPSLSAWVDHFPEDILASPMFSKFPAGTKFSKEEEFLACRNLVKQDPRNLYVYDEQCLVGATQEMRRELVSLALQGDSKIMRSLEGTFSRIPESEAKELKSLRIPSGVAQAEPSYPSELYAKLFSID